MNEDETNGFTKGIAYSIQLIEKEFGFGDFILEQSGMSLRDFEDAEVDDFDMIEIKKIFAKQEKVE